MLTITETCNQQIEKKFLLHNIYRFHKNKHLQFIKT